MMPISHSVALTESSMLLCILGLGITFVLFQEQRKLVGTDSSTAVSMLAPDLLKFLNLHTYQGRVSGCPQYQLWFPTDCHRLQPAACIIHLGNAPFCHSGFLDDVFRSAYEGIPSCRHSCGSRVVRRMPGYMDSPPPTQENFRRRDGAGICSPSYFFLRKRPGYGRSHSINKCCSLSHDTLCSRCISTYEPESNYKYSSKISEICFHLRHLWIKSPVSYVNQTDWTLDGCMKRNA